MKTFFFSIPGRAVPMMRPRINFNAIRRFKGAGRGGGPLVYTPYKCKKWQKLVAHHAITDAVEQGLALHEKYFIFPIAITIRFYLKRPTRSSKFALRPDVDNYAKNVLDALDGILWEDDAFVTHLNATKVFVEKDTQQRTEVWVSQGA